MKEFLVNAGWLLMIVFVVGVVIATLLSPVSVVRGLSRAGWKGAGVELESEFMFLGYLFVIAVALINCGDSVVVGLAALVCVSALVYGVGRALSGRSESASKPVDNDRFRELLVDPEFVRLAVLFSGYTGPMASPSRAHPSLQLWMKFSRPGMESDPEVRAVEYLRLRAGVPAIETAPGDWERLYKSEAVRSSMAQVLAGPLPSHP